MTDRVHVLVTVSRSYRDEDQMVRVLGLVHAAHPVAVLVHGNAKDGDQDAARIWKAAGGETLPWPAKWADCAPGCTPGHRRKDASGREWCPTAGIRRNAALVDQGPDLVVAFVDLDSKTEGAIGTFKLAVAAGLPWVLCRLGMELRSSGECSDPLGLLRERPTPTVRYNQETNHG